MIDAHLHFLGNHPDTVALLERYDLQVLNVTVALANRPWRQREAEPYRELARRWPNRYAWCTSFEPPRTSRHDDAYAKRVIDQLERDFADGAVACKIWKNVGMELADEAGRYIMPDDAVLDPVYAYLAEHGHTLLAHIAEPLACWQALEDMDPRSPHYRYYSSNPQWHMHGRTDMPDHAALMASRDRVLEKHPALRMVGAHFGSLEYDLNEMARRFDKYPNFAVDTSARLFDLMSHGKAAARDFLQTYPDRVLFGTDIIARSPHSEMDEAQRRELYAEVCGLYDTSIAYFTTAEEVERSGLTTPGLDLPEPVQRKLFTENAQTWYPRLKTQHAHVNRTTPR